MSRPRPTELFAYDLDALQTQIDQLATHVHEAGPGPNPGRDRDTVLAYAAEETRQELARADHKATSLLTVSGVGVSAAAAVLPQVPLPTAALALAGAGLAALLAAVVVALIALRPRGRPGHARTRLAWPHFATQPPDRIRDQLTRLSPADYHAGRLTELSLIAARKYRAVQRATALLLAALALLALAAVTALAG